MIWTLIVFFVAFAGLTLNFISGHYFYSEVRDKPKERLLYKLSRFLHKYDLDSMALVLGAVFAIIFMIFVLIIICAHINVDLGIESDTIRYETLCARVDLLDSEDCTTLVKSDVLKDVGEWNDYVLKEHYNSYNLWTSWFNSRRRADSLKYIDLDNFK